jgi:lipopolysaccharide export system permease protein
MIFTRSIVREFAQLSAVVGATLLAIMLSSSAIRLLGRAAGGKIYADAVASMLAFAAVQYLPVVVTLTVFIAVLLALSRSYRDSEMVVWFSSGRSLTAWFAPVLFYALPLAALVALITLQLWPWAQARSVQFQQQLTTRDDVSMVTPGVFIESRRADRVFFVEELAQDASAVGNIFVHSMEEGKVGITVASRGYQDVKPDGERFLVLQSGRHYQGTPGNADFGTVDFERYAMRIAPRKPKAIGEEPRALSVARLLRESTPANQAELYWRLSFPISLLVLGILAIPLSHVNPRAGRSTNLLIAILVYTIYNNLNSVMMAWIGQGKVAFAVGAWGVHAAMLAIALWLLWRRMRVRPPWLQFWRARLRAAQPT